MTSTAFDFLSLGSSFFSVSPPSSTDDEPLSSFSSSFSPSPDPIGRPESPARVIYQVACPEKTKEKQILVGKTRACLLQEDEYVGDLAENLALANDINRFVHDAVPLSNNYPNRTFICKRTQKSLDRSIDYVRRPCPYKEYIRRIKKEGVGNCAEMVDYGFECPLIKRERIERFHLQNGDHVFMVIGRDRHSDSTNPDDWNEDAVIADIWANAFYPAYKYQQHLYNYCTIMDSPEWTKLGYNNTVPIVEPLSPEHIFRREYSIN